MSDEVPEQQPVTEEVPAFSPVRLERPLLLDSSSLDITNFFYYTGAVSDEEICRLDQLSDKFPFVQGTVGSQVELGYRTSRVKWIPMISESAFLYERVTKLVMDANKIMWNFALSCFKEDGQYTEYDSAQESHYDWHMDVGLGAPTRKLSVSLQLSEEADYEGGELEIRIHRSTYKASKKKGTLIIFPSFLSHRVTPVTRGVRRSMVFWLHGPPFT